MIKAIIIDDEQHCISRLTKLLEENCNDIISLAATYDNITDATNGVQEIKPDLVFLDVMLNNATGFDFLKQFPSIDFDVIFTTAFDQFAVEAFRFSALDYLLKPIDSDDLLRAVGKAKQKESIDFLPAKLDLLFENLKNIGTDKRIAIPTMTGIDFIYLSDIIRCQSEGNYTIIYLKNRQKITVAKTLKEFEILLSGYDFFRVHNSHVVNLAYVKSFSKGKLGHIVMIDDSQIEVATRRKDDFLKRMLK